MAHPHVVWVPYPPPPSKSDKSDDDKDAHTFHYITRCGNDPHPPLLTNDNPRHVVNPQSMPFMGPHFMPSINPAMHFAHTVAQQPYSHYPIYGQHQMYPYGYPSPAATPAFTPSGYYPHPGMAYPPPQLFVPPLQSDGDGKKKRKKNAKVSDEPAKHHAWYGRTTNEVVHDDAVLASKSGANKMKEIKPNNAKPGDQFWVIDTDGSRYLRSFYEIENVHKPGQWLINPENGSLYFVKTGSDGKDDDGWA